MGLKSFFDKALESFFKSAELPISDLKTKSRFLISNNYLSNFYYKYLGKGTSDVINRIDEYRLMYKDPICFNALELMIDDATQYSPMTQKRVWPAIKGKESNNLIDELFSNLNIDEECWYHGIRLGTFGNCPIRIYYKDNKDFSGGISSIDIEENIFRYIPIEINGTLIKWIDRLTDKLLEPFEVVFGKINMLSDYNYLDYDYNISFKNNKEEDYIRYTFKYGTSLFENVRRVWRQLKLLEDSLILSRLDRAPSLRIYKVRSNRVKPQDAADLIDFYSSLLVKDEQLLSVSDDLLNSTSASIGFGKNIMLPVTDSRDIEMEEFGGNVDVASIVDVEYFERKFYAGLKTPKEYLGLTEDRGLSIGDNSLIRKEIQYARRVKKLQFAMILMYKKIAFYHLLSLKKDIAFNDVNIVMHIVSTAEDEEFKNSLDYSIDNSSSFMQLVNDLKDFVIDNDLEPTAQQYLLDYLTTRILNMSDFKWTEFFKSLLRSQPENDETIENNENANDSETDIENINDEQEKKESRLYIYNREIFESIMSDQRITNAIQQYNSQINDMKMLSKIPRAQYTKNLKYVLEVFKDSSRKFILESSKKEKYKITEISKLIDKISCFEIGIFGFNYEPIDISFDQYQIDKKYKFNDKIESLNFLENIYNIEQITNIIDSDIIVYEINNKLYSNYSNSCKIFKKFILESKCDNITVVKLKEKESIKN